ncbi:DUF2794 domain-containing protein [Roseospira visakhapatnamensis]|uniref:DUF2794 domain-containing protein n=1 Tax=Roseospira visakhapatnamensis TaxID=390880 RepID=A0A7W6RGK2_9PROT|nr:DUF2794 domain-containing protein [Roseospira visakhapatnamensis]MBB4268180.1 hypothetical protein [Roseospira visakhapatnamensis]
MSKIVRFLDYRRGASFVHFTRSEMNSLLSLYSRQVMRGEWRDYAIDQQDGVARFAVFRSTHERPLFVISKHVRGQVRQGMTPSHHYAVQDTTRKLAQAGSLVEVLQVLDPPMRLVRG